MRVYLNDRHHEPNERRIENFSSIYLHRMNTANILRKEEERGYARANNPSHWVFMDTDSISEIL